MASRQSTVKPGLAQLVAALGEIRAIVADLLGFAQIQIVEMARGEAVGHVHEQQARAVMRREADDVPEDGFVGLRVLDRDENVLIHVSPRRTQRTVWYSR